MLWKEVCQASYLALNLFMDALYLGYLFKWLVLWLQLSGFSVVCLFSALLIVGLLA